MYEPNDIASVGDESTHGFTEPHRMFFHSIQYNLSLPWSIGRPILTGRFSPVIGNVSVSSMLELVLVVALAVIFNISLQLVISLNFL